MKIKTKYTDFINESRTLTLNDEGHCYFYGHYDCKDPVTATFGYDQSTDDCRSEMDCEFFKNLASKQKDPNIDLSMEYQFGYVTDPRNSPERDDFLKDYVDDPTTITDQEWDEILLNTLSYKNFSDKEFIELYNKYRRNI